MKNALSVSILILAMMWSGCLDGSGADDPGDGPPKGPTAAVPTAAPDGRPEGLPREQVDLCAAEDACFTFIWVIGQETEAVVEAPEDHPAPKHAYCGRPSQEDPNFVHEVDLDNGTIFHAEDVGSPTDLLVVFDHWQQWNGCGIPYAWVEDIGGRLPVTMGRGGTYWFGPDTDGFSAGPSEVAPGTKVSFAYNETERRDPYVLDYVGRFEVRNHGQWPVSALEPVA